MIRALTRTFRLNFSQQLNAPRRNKSSAVSKAKPAEVAESQSTAKLYLEFEALPTDPLSLIRQRFIRKKRALANRRIYIANKKEYMLKLDGMLKQIELRHKDEVSRQSYTLPATVGERVSQLIEAQENEFYVRILKDDTWIIGASLALIALMAYIEMMYCQIP